MYAYVPIFTQRHGIQFNGIQRYIQISAKYKQNYKFNMAASRTAKKGDWKTTNMPEKNKTVPLNVGFSDEQMGKIKSGFIPEEMEDKWFIYYVEEEQSLYLHRSWTGFCVYIVQFKVPLTP